jgi:rhamnosyltransferase
MKDILAVVILYNPDTDLQHRIGSYISHVSKLVIIDNSEPPVPWLSSWDDKILIIRNHKNLGIGEPLNMAAKIAIENNYEWILTMDQDSVFQTGSFDELKSVATEASDDVALVTPFHFTPKATPPKFNERTKNIKLTMTSGNLLRTSAFKTAGPFEEKLFIDSVDHEYYLRLRKHGFKILRANNSILLHPLGEIEYRKFLFIKLKSTNHSALRRYYITRNRLYVSFKYFFSDFWFFFRESRELIKSFFVVLLMDDDKGKKIRMIIKGIVDFIRGKYGRLQESSHRSH